MVAFSDDLLPHDVHPGLQPERLTAVASLLVGTLVRTQRNHRPEAGEGNWSLGTRYCERRIAALTRASEEWPWLGVMDPSRRFIFTMEGFPLRVATGSGDRLRKSMRRLDSDEQSAHQLALFAMGDDGPEFVWRLIVDTSGGWTMPRVTLIQAWADGGEPRRSWPVPLDRDAVARWIDEEFAPPHDVDPLDLGWLDDLEDGELGQASGE